jgi:pyruvate dehydrogenase E2 component (dihydrolipoamide acetyltransferase)
MAAAATASRVEVAMPVLADGMEQGTLLTWLAADGAGVEAGEAIAEIETDKAIAELEAPLSGVLSHRVPAGTAVAVGTLIAIVGEAHEGPAAAAPEPAQPPAPQGAKASPLARRLARELGVDLATVRGSGADGRVVKADVEAAASGSATPTPTSEIRPSPPAPSPAGDRASAKGELEVVELTRMQQVVATRMAEAKATVPEFALSVDVEMDGCLALRSELKRSWPDPIPSLNDMVIKVVALALREQPLANASFRDGHLELHGRVNVGFAVAGEGRLVVPTVFDADAKPLSAIARDSRQAAERAREGSITAPELAGGTFTVSNLGMFGVGSFTAVINPPQAAILAVGTIEPRPVARDGAVVVRQMATLTLTCDHRVLYGADAAQLLDRIRRLLEQPAAAFAR